MRRLSEPDADQDVIFHEELDEDDQPTDKDGDPPVMRMKIEAMRHAWSYFEHHDDHRLTLFRFFLLTFAALAALFFEIVRTTSNADPDLVPAFQVLIAVTGFISATIFLRLDRRSQQLVDTAKAPLQTLQADLSRVLGIPTFQIIARSEEKTIGLFRRFNTLLPAFFRIAQAISLIALIYLYKDIVRFAHEAAQWGVREYSALAAAWPR